MAILEKDKHVFWASDRPVLASFLFVFARVDCPRLTLADALGL